MVRLFDFFAYFISMLHKYFNYLLNNSIIILHNIMLSLIIYRLINYMYFHLS